MDYIRYITEGIESICKHHKRRTAGSETVRSAQAEMAASMKDCVDEIRTQQFEIHPQAFMGSVPLEAFLCLISCAFFLRAFSHRKGRKGMITSSTAARSSRIISASPPK